MRSRFDEQLEELYHGLLEMGLMVEDAVKCATEALVTQDKELAKKTQEEDFRVDDKEKEIESTCLKLLLQQHPVASDLRLISSALKMITDMERIGDQAADISELVLYIADSPYIKRIDHMQQMAEVSMQMLNKSIDAFVRKDIDAVHTVIEMDDIVDDLFVTVKKELIELIHRDENNGEQAIDLIMIAKYYERIGDHAVNIAKWVRFSITGIHRE